MSVPYRPKQLQLGPLEQEILTVLWDLGESTTREIQEHLLRDPDRELSNSAVHTVLNRLTIKGWVAFRLVGRVYHWQSLISAQAAKALAIQSHLHHVLEQGVPEVVAALVDTLDEASLQQLQTITQRVAQARAQRQEPPCTS